MGKNSNNTCGGNLIEFIRPVIVLRLGGIVSATHTVRQRDSCLTTATILPPTHTRTEREGEGEREKSGARCHVAFR